MNGISEPKFCANVLYFDEFDITLTNKYSIRLPLLSQKTQFDVILHYRRRAFG